MIDVQLGAPWDDLATLHLSRAALGHLNYFRDRVEGGGSTLGYVVCDGERIGSLIVHGDGDDFVIPVAGARLPGTDLTAVVLPVLEGVAAQCGAARVRVHTFRPGLARKLSRMGYERGGEDIDGLPYYVKAVSDGRPV